LKPTLGYILSSRSAGHCNETLSPKTKKEEEEKKKEKIYYVEKLLYWLVLTVEVYRK
jgi:hypothetical protein